MTFSELRNSSKRESDYPISILLTNEISLLITWYFINKTNITPNQVTIVSCFCGLVTGFFFAFGGFFAGALFLFLFHILDCTDGNLARAKNMTSDYGRWLDFVGNRIVEIFVFWGSSLYLFRSGAYYTWIILPVLASQLLLLYYYIVDVSLSLGISQKNQHITSIKIKGTHVKIGLYEPVLYGFIILTPFGLLKIQVSLVLFLVSAAIIYQFYKKVR